MRPWIAIVFVTLAAAAPARAGDPVRLPDPPASVATGLRLETVAKGLRRPVLVTFAPGDASGRLFVVEQHTGQVRILRGGVAAQKPLVDLGKRISKEDEQGLLGLAFHPRFAEN